MTKRLLAFLLSTVMVLSMLPVGVMAEGADTLSTAQQHTKYETLTTHDGSHICEHCIAAGKTEAEATVEWKAWGDNNEKTLPTTTGHYYLTKDMNVTVASIESGDIVLCLNGKTVTANGTEATSADRFYYLKKTATVTITDCTAKLEGDVYTAGKLTGATACGIMTDNSTGTKNTATVTVYDGIFSGNSRSGAGGAFCIQGDTKLYIYGGEISENTAQSGAAVYLGNTKNTMVMENARIIGNTSTTGAGAIRNVNAAAVTIKDSQLCDNTGVFSSAVYSVGVVTLENVTITGNHSTGANADYQFGAVGVNNTLTLKGQVTIIDNTLGSAKNNLYLRTDKLIKVEGLTADSQIGITAQSAALGLVMSDALADPSVVSCFKSDVSAYAVEVADGKLVLAEAPVTHETSGHDCEHCDEENVVWTPWDNSNATLPTAAGHYYLTEDLSVVKADLSADVVLCLNGYTVTCNGSYNTANDRFYYLKNSGTITVTDCTATGSGDSYKAGKFTGASASAFMFDNVNTSVGSINIYDGIFDGNFRSSSGGVFAVQGKGTLNIYGGLYINNSTNGGGAVINLVSNNNHVHIENAVFKNNTAASKGGVLFNNYLSNVTIKDTVIIGNTATDGGAIYAKGALTLENTQITDNKTTGQSGAVTLANAGAQTMTIKGSTQINANTDGAEANRNVCMLDEANKIAVENLAGTAAISVSGEKGKVLTDALDNADAIVSCFAADDAELIVAVKDGKLVLDSAEVIVPDHPHNLCNDSACADHGEMDFKNWTDPNSLPTNGSYSLQTDVTLTAAVAVEGKLNLCLNGHTITVAAENTRAIGLDNGDVLSITDCQATGKITGGNCKYGGAIVVARGATFNLFAGAITGNDALTEEGGAVYVGAGNDTVKQGGIFNMYGGELSNNKARQGAAVRLTAPSGAGTNAQFNMYGGKIIGNSTTTGGGAAIYAGKATVKLLGGEISGNTTGANGTIYAGANIDLTIADVTITGNTAGNGAGIYLNGETAHLTLSGNTTILGNTAGDKANNLVLNDTAVITVDQLGQSAKIGVTATVGNRAISGENETDYSGFFQSDSVYKLIRYKEKMLFIEATSDHSHCICSANTSGCDHAANAWQAWDVTTSLPTAEGNYYLVDDVVLTATAAFSKTTNICLNGHTVSLKEGTTGSDGKGVRLIGVNGGAVVSITDCAGTGKLTGGNRTYGSCVNIAAGGTFNLYNGTITGNVCKDESGGMGTIYAGGENAVVNIYGGEISGNTAHWGGAVYGVTSAYVNVYGGLLANNEAYRGGAIFATNILLDGATIRDNHTTSHGGGIYVSGGEATIKNSLIEGNSTVGSAGAIMASGKGTKLIIDNTIIQNNHGGGYAGGAIQAQTTGTEVNITNSQIIGNTIVSNGGAIYMSYDTILNVESTTFTGNMAEKGACIFEERAVINLGKGVVMEGNIADTTNANASRRAAGIYMAAGELNIDGAVIKNNYGLKNGQKISVSGVAITTTHSDETVKDENGQDTKVRHYSTVNMLSGSIVGNKANSGAVLIQGKATFNLKGGEISDNTGSYAGGVYISTNATFNMSGGKISGNSGTSAGGGVYLQQATFNMTAGTISGNTSKGHGGGIYAARGTMNLKGGSITGNVATNSGGGIFASGAAVNLSGTSITYNKAEKGSGGGGICTGARGENGITYNATIVMTGGYIANNDSKNGGGILLQGSDKTTMVMYGGEVANNVSRGDGGGVYISTKTTFTMEGGKIYGNEAAGRGGAVNHLKSTGVYTGGEIYDNYAGNTAGAIQAGNVGTDVTVKNMVFRNNNAAKFGGTFQMNGTAKLYLENVEIIGSTCETAGAIYVSNSHYFEAVNLKIVDSHSTKHGGAMFLGNDATIRIDGLWIENCSSDRFGGAIYGRSANTIIKNATFIGNTGTEKGGAIALHKPTLQGVAGSSNFKVGFVLENAVFRDNKTSAFGGALTVDSGSKCTLTNVVMENNTSTGDGSALHAVGETTINGLVATGNIAENNGYAVYLADSEYDGQSFIHGMMRFGGDMIVKDNQGGDMYMGEQTTASVLDGAVGENTEMHITLASGLLTNKLFGAYNYEGGDQVYVVTYGNRSLTEPEYEEKTPEETQPEETTETVEPAEAGEDNTLLYAAIGGIAAVIVLAAVILVIIKKKSGSKAGKE